MPLDSRRHQVCFAWRIAGAGEGHVQMQLLVCCLAGCPAAGWNRCCGCHPWAPVASDPHLPGCSTSVEQYPAVHYTVLLCSC